MIIADTNLVAYYLLEADQTPLARAMLQGDPDWAAPPILHSELLNVLTLHIRLRGLPPGDALTLFERAMKMVRTLPPPAPAEVLQLGVASELASYDCEFVACAKREQVRLVTFDVKILAAFPAIAISPRELLA